jgi:hypothetical protein
MIDLRCDNALHGRLDPVRKLLEVKCGKCSKKSGKDVFHYFPLDMLVIGPIEQQREEPRPVFVRWRVVAAQAA